MKAIFICNGNNIDKQILIIKNYNITGGGRAKFLR